MKPIIKWSGGKSQEIKFFQHKFPSNYTRYIEPFVGGAGVYFNLEKNNSIINDINFELTTFYKIISQDNSRKDFLFNLHQINKQRDIFNNFFESISSKDIELLFSIIDLKKDISFSKAIEIVSILDEINLNKLIQKSLKDKIKRINEINLKKDIKFSVKELKDHLTTALQSALYFNSREIYNNGFNENNIKITYYIAHWYYVREFCYSSMFRFSSTGKFNVPYGGIGYNKKDFSSKINSIEQKFSPQSSSII